MLWGGFYMNYKVIDKDNYYRKDVFKHFTKDCKCSTSITARIDVTKLVRRSEYTQSKFHIDFLYLLSKVLNSRDDYKMAYLYETDELICYDVINPKHYVFHKDSETCTPVYSEYHKDYRSFYRETLKDIEAAKESETYNLDDKNHPNYFDASYIPWVSYDSLNIELPDGYLYFAPIINWGKYREEKGRIVLPLTVRLNHAIADGYLVANVFKQLEKEIEDFCKGFDKMSLFDGKFIFRQRTDESVLIYCQDIEDIGDTAIKNDRYTLSVFRINGDNWNKLKSLLDENNPTKKLYDEFYVTTHVEDWFDSGKFKEFCNKNNVEFRYERRSNIWFKLSVEDNIKEVFNYLEKVGKLKLPERFSGNSVNANAFDYCPLAMDLENRTIIEVRDEIAKKAYADVYDILNFDEIRKLYI